ncbi:unnamed protein product [Effrenium voratum]|nr:unnamed protein product [Effrenium voratum]
MALPSRATSNMKMEVPTPSTRASEASAKSKEGSCRSYSKSSSCSKVKVQEDKDHAEKHALRMEVFGKLLEQDGLTFQRLIGGLRSKMEQPEDPEERADEDFSQAMNCVRRSSACFLGRHTCAATERKRQMVCL